MAKVIRMSDAAVIQDITGKDVVIIGPPASGKTHLSNLLRSPHHTIIHTDEYIKFGYVEGLYELMNDLKKIDGKVIIEGMLGYRLLRKGVEMDAFYPDVVIELQVPRERIVKTYMEQRERGKLAGALSFAKACETVLNEYKQMYNPNPPEWNTLQNNY